MGKRVICKICGKDGTTVVERVPIPTFLAPFRVSKQSFLSPPVGTSKGNVTDGATFCHVLEISQKEYALGQQQILEMQDVTVGKQALAHINLLLLSAAGLDVQPDAKHNDMEVCSTSKALSGMSMSDSWCVPTTMLTHLTPKEVKQQIGFYDLKMLLLYVAVICGGDLTIMTHTTSILIQLEEWVFYFEVVWGWTIIRFKDYATTYCCRQ
jgi:hypothetical protein